MENIECSHLKQNRQWITLEEKKEVVIEERLGICKRANQ